MAAGLAGNDGVYFVPAFVGLGAPHWEAEARGALFGLTRGTSREHLVRAALEAMAYGTYEVLSAMEADSGVQTTELRVDGGASKNDWLMSFQAGILDCAVRRPAIVETTALGAAGLAGLATGVWASAEDFGASSAVDRTFEPDMPGDLRRSLIDGWTRATAAVKHWTRSPAG
jgi:glycerol kinase